MSSVLVFGSGSAPTVWGRYGAFLGRSTAAILGPDPVRLQVYVDDPIYAAAAQPKEAARYLAVALLWARVAGFPLAWKKTECGSSLRWIGAQVTVEADAVSISIPEDKGSELVPLHGSSSAQTCAELGSSDRSRGSFRSMQVSSRASALSCPESGRCCHTARKVSLVDQG